MLTGFGRDYFICGEGHKTAPKGETEHRKKEELEPAVKPGDRESSKHPCNSQAKNTGPTLAQRGLKGKGVPKLTKFSFAVVATSEEKLIIGNEH